jgi:hypothetical protein
VVSKDGKFPDPKKIQAIQDMPRPQWPIDGLAQFNHCYIKDYARIIEPITRLMRKTQEFDWTNTCEATWTEIKLRYQNAPILIVPRWELEFHVHIDASNVAVGAMLA